AWPWMQPEISILPRTPAIVFARDRAARSARLREPALEGSAVTAVRPQRRGYTTRHMWHSTGPAATFTSPMARTIESGKSIYLPGLLPRSPEHRRRAARVATAV